MKIPFEWGRNDCVSFACDAVLAVTAVNLLEDYQGKYTTEEQAREFLTEYGDGFIGQMKQFFKDLPHISIKRAWRGDVILFEHDRDVSVGVVDYGHIWGPGPKGLVSFDFDRGLRAWGVGHE